MRFDESEELPDLIGLRLPSVLLKAEKRRNLWVREDVMTSGGPLQLESSGLRKADEVHESHVLKMTGCKAGQQLARLHGWMPASKSEAYGLYSPGHPQGPPMCG